jgi:DNA mismatch repair protein MutL
VDSAAFAGEGRTIADRLRAARFLGTFALKYHLFEEGDSLFAVDQHAAQERIMFERFSAQLASGKVEVQALLMPAVVRLSPAEMLAWEEAGERLTLFGMETSQLDPTAVSIHAYPALLSDPEAILRILISGDDVAHVSPDTLARRACRASVMTGDVMTPEAAAHQLKALSICRDPMTCPHGRPVFIELKVSFFDRQFFR